MGSEGGGGGGGLFHLFGWNRKSRKKLFPDGNASSGKPFSFFLLIDLSYSFLLVKLNCYDLVNPLCYRENNPRE